MSFQCLEPVHGCLKLHVSDDGGRNGGPEAEIALMFAFFMSFIWQDFDKIYPSGSVEEQSQFQTNKVTVSRTSVKWRGIDVGDIKCRGSDEEPAFIAARINLSLMLTQGKIMQILNAALAAHSSGSCSCSDGAVTGSKGGSQHSFQTETDTRTDYPKFEEEKCFVFTLPNHR